MDLPRPSQHAVVTQRIGITDVTINYHRPLTNGRKIWDALVPYGQVWRAGANENTTISFSDPVTIEGKSLDAGTYGLHMIPTADQWTVIFSKNYTSWGSFSYNEKEDALRVQVKPQPTDMHDALTYDFDDPKDDSAIVTMRWEKLAVPFRVGVDVKDTVAASLHNQLRGLPQYSWFGWDDAANYLLASKVDLDDALKYSDRSIQNEERFENLSTKARVLRAMNKIDDSKAVEAKALAKATPLQVHMFARQLQADRRQEEAYAIFRTNAKAHPNEWFVHSGLARVYCSQGDFDNAAKEMKIAMQGAPDDGTKAYVATLVKRLEAKDDINK
jgi:tetratricopeptide (TPR) repeat protein